MDGKMFASRGWYSRLEKVMYLVTVNLLLVVACLPLVTIGPAIAAAFCLLQEDVSSLSATCVSFWTLMRRKLQKEWVVTNFPLLYFLLMLACAFYLPQLSQQFLLAVVWLLLMIWSFAFSTVLFPHFFVGSGGVKQRLQHALRASLRDIHKSIRLFSLNSLMSLLFLVSFVWLPMFSFVWVTIGFAVWIRLNVHYVGE